MSTFEQTSLSQTKKNNICQVCGKNFKRSKDLKSHFVIHSDLKPFVCNLCPEAFKHKASLKRHILIHSGEKPFDCKICGKCFRQKGSLNEHLLTHTGEKPHTCEICCTGFTTRSNYIRHLRKHLNSKPFSCTVCGKDFNVISTLKRHYKGHVKSGQIISMPSDIQRDGVIFDADSQDSVGEKPSTEKQYSKVIVVNGEVKQVEEFNKKMYSCKICKKQFHGHKYLKSHLASHLYKKHYTCNLCFETFYNISAFCKHKLTHSQEQLSNNASLDEIIKMCEVSFDKIDSLQKHLKNQVGNSSKSYDEHGTESTGVTCNICCQTFEKEFEYIDHSFEHNITGPFECDICYDKRIFENLSELHEHYSRHDDTPCLCFACNSSYTDFIVSAQNTYSGSFHKCSLCHKCFIDASLLQKHYAMHKSRRPYLVKLVV